MQSIYFKTPADYEVGSQMLKKSSLKYKYKSGWLLIFTDGILLKMVSISRILLVELAAKLYF